MALPKEARSHSEPPQHRAEEAFDDPFEPPPQESPWEKRAQGLPGMATVHARPRCAGEMAEPARETRCGPAPDRAGGAEGSVGAKRWASPARGGGEELCTASTRAPSSGLFPGTPSGHRARSLTRGALGTESPTLRSRSPEVRSHSEPPQHRAVEVFDDPFEPPPQESRWAAKQQPHHPCQQLRDRGQDDWVLPLPQLPTLAGLDSLGPIVGGAPFEWRFSTDPSFVPPGMHGAGEPQPIYKPKRWSSPVRHDESSVVSTRAPSCRGRSPAAGHRARSLTRHTARSHEGAALRSHSPEFRSHSEPPQQRNIEVFDDPFEPPPQEVTWTPTLRQAAAPEAANVSPAVFDCSAVPSEAGEMPLQYPCASGPLLQPLVPPASLPGFGFPVPYVATPAMFAGPWDDQFFITHFKHPVLAAGDAQLATAHGVRRGAWPDTSFAEARGGNAAEACAHEGMGMPCFGRGRAPDQQPKNHTGGADDHRSLSEPPQQRPWESPLYQTPCALAGAQGVQCPAGIHWQQIFMPSWITRACLLQQQQRS